MIHWLIDLLTSAAERRLRDCLLGSILVVLGALFAAVGLGFATFAGYVSLRASEGAATAALIVCAVYALLALSIWVIALLRRLSRRPSLPPAAPVPASAGSLEALLLSLTAGGASKDQPALTAAAQLGRELSTMQLLAVALLGGFLAGRKLGN